MKTLFHSTACLALPLLLAAAPPGVRAQQSPAPPSVSPAVVAGADNAFGFQLFQRLARKDAGQNLFVSPYSVATCLAMAYNGTAGDTQAAMAHVLALDGVSLDDLNDSNLVIQAALEGADPKVEVQIANSLWVRNGLALSPDYQRRVQQSYSATVRNVNFQNSEASSAINQWVNEHTNGKIPQIVQQLDPRDLMVLVNAVYFLGTWTLPFDANSTRPQPFYPDGGASRTLPMMNRSAHFDYQENDTFQAIRLPYGSGRFAMYIFLPKPGVSVETLETQLTPQTWAQWLVGFRDREGSFALPRFKVEYRANLNEALVALGMGIAYSPGAANFIGMFPNPDSQPFISSVIHKTYVRVDEKGTEAAAATAITMFPGGMAPPPVNPFRMTCDHPFLSVMVDRDTGAILFLGAVHNPPSP